MRLVPLAVLVVAWVALVLWAAPIALLFGLPWIVAIVWAARRAGVDIVAPTGGRAIESQADRLPSFGAGRQRHP